MERSSSEDGNGGLKLPIGFRFHPTDEELVLYYLKRKVCSVPLPATVIPDFEVFQSSPWDLPGDSKEKRYFFCKRKRNFINTLSPSFSTHCGYWRATGKDKQIMAPGSNLVIGMKKSFVFFQGKKKSRGLKTHWILNEFCLAGSITAPHLTQKLMMRMGDWVVCCVYERPRKARNHGMANYDQLANSKKSRSWQRILTGGNMHLRIGDNRELGFSSAAQISSSSCSSGITEISCSDLDQEASSRNVRF